MKLFATTLGLGAMTAVLFISAPAQACDGCRHHKGADAEAGENRRRHHGKGHGLMRKLMKAAKLTPAQKTQMKAMRDEAHKDHKKMGKAGHGKFVSQMADAIESGDLDAMDSLFEAKQERMAKRHQRRHAKLKNMLSILTDEQRTRVAAKMRKMKGKHGKAHGH